jgi:hypothetical protein
MKISIMTSKKKKLVKTYFPSFSSKNLSFEIYSRKFLNSFFFSLQLMKKYENLVTKSYPYGNASSEKTVKAARLKIFESIDKSLSELLKKNGESNKGPVLELYRF